MGLRGYEDTGVQGYMPHHRLRTLHTQAQARSPAARSPKPPLPPHLCTKGGSPKTSLCLLFFIFLADRVCPGRVRVCARGGRGEQCLFCYVGPHD